MDEADDIRRRAGVEEPMSTQEIRLILALEEAIDKFRNAKRPSVVVSNEIAELLRAAVRVEHLIAMIRKSGKLDKKIFF